MEIKEMKNYSNMGSLLAFYGIKKGKQSYSWHCPLHDDTSASFLAKEDEHRWSCRTCGVSGDEIEFIQLHEKVDKIGAINKFKEIYNIKDEAISKYPLQPLNKDMLKLLLEKRGIKKETADFFELKMIVPNSGEYENQRTRIYFPEKRFGFIQSYKYINLLNKKDQGVDGTDRDPKLFPDYNFEGIKTLIIVCGQWDALIFWQMLKDEYPSKLETTKVITMTSGEKSIPKDLNRLKKYNKTIEKVYYFEDGDEPGIEASALWGKALSLLGFTTYVKRFPKEERIESKEGKAKIDVNDAYKLKHWNIKNFFDLEEIEYRADEVDEFAVKESDKDLLKDQFWDSSTNIQKAILNYLIVNNHEFKSLKNEIDSSLFLNAKCKSIYEIYIERMYSIGVFNFDKLKEINSEYFKFLISTPIEILNSREAKEKVDTLNKFVNINKLQTYKRQVDSLLEKAFLDVNDSNKIMSDLNLSHSALFQTYKGSNKKIETTLYDAKNLIIQGEIGEDQYIDISKKYPRLHVAWGYGICRGKLHLLAGRPSTGKTTFVTQLLEDLAEQSPLGLYELEMRPWEIAQQSFARSIKGLPLHAFKKFDYYKDSLDLMKKKNKESDKNFYIFNGYKTPAEILQHMKYMLDNYGITVFAVDHFHRMTMTADSRFATEIATMNYWIHMFTDFCDAYGVTIIMLCQMNRVFESKGGNLESKPQLSHLKGTGALEEDAYTATFMYSPDGVGKAQSSSKVNLLVAKSRGGEAGTDIEYFYDRPKALFQEVEEQTEER